MQKKFKNFIYFAVILAFLSILPAMYFSLAGDSANTSVLILNLVDNQTLNSNYTIKLQSEDFGNLAANAQVTDVELRFHSNDSNNSDFGVVTHFAARDSEGSSFWHYDLQIDDFADGYYNVKTFAYYSGGGVRAGEMRNFYISHSSTTTNVEVNIGKPQADETISGIYSFIANVNTPVDELDFKVYDSDGTLQRIASGTQSSDDELEYSTAVDSTEFDNGSYKVQAAATLNGATTNSNEVYFNIYNDSDENDTATTTNSTTTNDIATTTVEVDILTPEDGAFVSGRILLQASVSTSVQGLNFYVNSEYIAADSFEKNIWQAYLDTTSYDNNSHLDIIAKAAGNDEQTYNSDVVSVIVSNPINNEDDNITQNQDDNDKNSSQDQSNNTEQTDINTDDSVNDSQTSIDTNDDAGNNDKEEKNQNNHDTTDNENKNDNKQSDNQINKQDKQDKQDAQADKCIDYKNQKISCADYLTNNFSVPDDCVSSAVDIDACQIFKNDCQELGFDAAYDLCQQYLNEPRPSRWCDLDEFKNLPVCAEYNTNQNKNQQINISGLDQRCVEQKILDETECENYLQFLQLPQICQDKNILNKEKCRQFMRDNYFNIACQQLGISDKQACVDYLVSVNADKYVCNSGDCRQLVKDKYVEELAFLFVNDKQLRSFIPEVENKNFQKSTIDKSVSAKTFANRLPVVYKNQSFKVTPAEDKIFVSEETLTTALPVVVVYDTDNDGLPDDIEKRLGTDVLNPDSDNDGYLDGEEVKNGYDPLQPAKTMDTNLAPIEQALLSDKELEQPLYSGEISKDLEVRQIKNDSAKNIEKEGMSITGTGPAFAVITIYLYSDLPLVATVQVDANGHWQYDLQDSLVDGEHKIYVAINDDTGKIVKKSAARNFFIKGARAVSVGEYVDLAPQENPKIWERYYLIGFILMIILAIGLSFAIYKKSFSSSHKQ